MRVVIDTNVIISAALKDRKPEEVIRFIVTHPQDFQWIASAEIIAEYLSVLQRRKFHLPAENLQDWRFVFEKLCSGPKNLDSFLAILSG